MERNLLLILLLFVVSICAQNAPNASVCTQGVSKCDGSVFDCVCQNGGLCLGAAKTFCNCSVPLVWGGYYCHLPMCVGPNFPNGCVHGSCIGPGVCQCNPGFTGFDCSQAIVCTPGTSKCNVGNCTCQHGGTCGGLTNTQCACPAPQDYAGDYCQLPQCAGANFPAGCHTGQCISARQCQCNPGWNGTDCGNPICTNACIHGHCVGPNVCACDTGYAHCEGQFPVCGCDENECLRGHSPCDRLSTCVNFAGGYNCTACPAGYPGSPYVYYPGADVGNFTVSIGGCNQAITSAPSSAPATTGAAPETSNNAATSAQTNASQGNSGTQANSGTQGNSETQNSASGAPASSAQSIGVNSTMSTLATTIQDSKMSLITPCALVALACLVFV